MHLVEADDQLRDVQKVEQTSMRTGLSLHLVGVRVNCGNGRNKVTVSGTLRTPISACEAPVIVFN